MRSQGNWLSSERAIVFFLERFQKHSSCVILWKVTLTVHCSGNASTLKSLYGKKWNLIWISLHVKSNPEVGYAKKEKGYVKLKLTKSWWFERMSFSLCWGILTVTVWMESLCTATVWSQKWAHYWQIHYACAHTHTFTLYYYGENIPFTYPSDNCNP